jgi:hypothetical protein
MWLLAQQSFVEFTHGESLRLLLVAEHEKLWRWDSFSGTVFRKICQMRPRLLKMDA